MHGAESTRNIEGRPLLTFQSLLLGVLGLSLAGGAVLAPRRSQTSVAETAAASRAMTCTRAFCRSWISRRVSSTAFHNASFFRPFGSQLTRRARSGRAEQVGKLIRQNAVVLFRHAAVPTSETGFDMDDGDACMVSSQCTRQRAVRIPEDHDGLGTESSDRIGNPLHHVRQAMGPALL